MSIDHDALDAMRRQDIDGMLAAIKRGAATAPVWVGGQTLLILAAMAGEEAPVRALIPLSNVLHADSNGMTALMHASKRARAACVRALLPFSDPLAQNNDGHDAMMVTMREAGAHGLARQVECLRLLIPVSDATRPQGAGLSGGPGVSAWRRANSRINGRAQLSDVFGSLDPLSEEAVESLSLWGEEALPLTRAARKVALEQAALLAEVAQARGADQSAAGDPKESQGSLEQGKPAERKIARRI